MKDQYDYKEPQEARENFERAHARHSRVPHTQPTARVLIRFPLLMSFVAWPESTCTFVILTNPRFGLPSSWTRVSGRLRRHGAPGLSRCIGSLKTVIGVGDHYVNPCSCRTCGLLSQFLAAQ